MNARRPLAVATLVCPLLLLAAGCDSGPIAAMKRVTKAEKALADKLETVHDAESARDAITGVDRHIRELTNALEAVTDILRENPNARVSQQALERVMIDNQAAADRMGRQFERVSRMRGLPIEFWRVVRVGALNIAKGGLELVKLSPQAHLLENVGPQFEQAIGLMKTHGHDRVVVVDFRGGLPANSRDKVMNKLRAAAPGATFVEIDGGDEVSVVFGPVEDYRAVVRALDFGSITFEDEAQRHVEMRVHLGRLDEDEVAGRPSSGWNHDNNPGYNPHRRANEQDDALPPDPAAQALDAQRQAEEAMRRAQQEEESRREHERNMARAKEVAGPDQSDPEYFEKMLQRMQSADRSIRDRTLDDLLEANPAQVRSQETAAQIARQFKALLSDTDSRVQQQAVEGVVRWGGQYSAPLLAKTLAQGGCNDQTKKLILLKLGPMQNAEAARPAAALLNNFWCREEAYRCLEQLGPSAETALIEIAPSPDADVCLAAIQLLGKSGTSKALPVLRAAVQSSNQNVRELAKAAIRQIRLRETPDPNTRPAK